MAFELDLLPAIPQSPTTEFLDLTWCDENQPITEAWPPQTHGKQFRSRRSHTKSRAGCSECKKRRIKCDETKPDCGQCQKHGIPCHYLPLKDFALTPASHGVVTLPRRRPDQPCINLKNTSMAHVLVENYLSSMLGRSQLEPATKSVVTTFRHFEHIAHRTLGSPSHERVLSEHAISLSRDTPFLLQAMFAYAARHLSILQPSNRQHERDAHYHGQRATELYAEQSRRAIPVEKMDAWVAAFMILSALSFHDESDPDPRHSFLVTENLPKADGWLNLMSMLRNLLQTPDVKSFVAKSVWLPVLEDFDDAEGSFTDMRPGQVGIDPVFADLCGITSTSTAANNIYHGALRLLMPMERIEHNVENFSKLITFPCRMHPDFIALYRAHDAAALLIMAHWFACMCRVEHWWCTSRAKTECLAICQQLDESPDKRVQQLLQFPMSRCGYVAIDPDMIQMCVFGM